MTTWTDICKTDDIPPNSGRAALFNGQQIAIFRTHKNNKNRFYAVGNYCPFANVNAISRGIIGSIGEAVVVASPLYKQHFCLVSGRCIEDAEHRLDIWQVRVLGDTVQLAE